MSRRTGIVVAAVAAAAALVLVGRWEGSRFADSQNDGIGRTLAAIGLLDDDSLAHYRYEFGLTCLVYERGGNDVALEVCVDDRGRIIEAVDRRDGDERWSLRPDPEAAEHRTDPALVQRLTRDLLEEAKAEARRRLEAGES